MLAWLLWSVVAHADEPQPRWEQAQAALIEDALGGDLDASGYRYQALVDTMVPNESERRPHLADPNLPSVLYWLGHARWTMGDLDGARAALDQCIRSGFDKDPCLDLRSRIDLDADAIRTVPVSWSFDDEHHGFFHPRNLWHRGSLRSLVTDQSAELQWTTTLDGNTQDELVVAFRDPSPAPAQIHLVARSEVLDGALQILLEDVHGNTYVAEAKPIPMAKGKTADITLALSAFRSTVPGMPSLDATSLRRLRLRDATTFTGQTGGNVWAIDLFEVK